MLSGKKALLLDMNSTFMFGEDRFGASEDFSIHYREIGGALAASELNRIIRAVYQYLEVRYSDAKYRDRFPSLERALLEVTDESMGKDEIERIVATFAFHELGRIPDEYAVALHKLRRRFTLAAVIDIWSPKQLWLEEFDRAGVFDLFSAMSFSSDHGIVKPSPKPFQWVLQQLNISASEAIVIGDSPRRDLGGAKSAGIDCVLVGGATHPDASNSVETLASTMQRNLSS